MRFDPSRDLTKQQEKLFWLLWTCESTLTVDAAMKVLYGHLKCPPEDQVVKVMLCLIRKKLARHDVAIQTFRGRGWRFDPISRERLTQLMAKETA